MSKLYSTTLKDVMQGHTPEELFQPEVMNEILQAYDRDLTYLFSEKVPPREEILKDFGRHVWQAMSCEAQSMIDEV